MDLLKYFRRNPAAIENRGVVNPENPQSHADLWPMAFVPQEIRITGEEAITIGAVWGCLRAIVDPLASSTINVVTRDASGARQTLLNDPVAWLLNVRPNPDMTAQAFKEILLTQTMISGNGYAEIVRDLGGRVTELQALRSDRMAVQRRPDGQLIYRYTQDQGEIAYLEPSQVLHVRGPCIEGLLGDSAVGRAAKAVALAQAEHQFASAYFASGTVVGGVIKVPAQLTPELQADLAAQWKAKHGGRAAHSVAILQAGVDFQQFETDAQKAQLVESRRMSVEDVARYFGVPLVLLQVSQSAQGYGSNLRELMLDFTRRTLTPWCNRLTEELAFKLFPQRSPWREVELDLAWLTQGTELDRAQAAQLWIRNGVYSPNEIRAQEGQNAREGGDEYVAVTAAAPSPMPQAANEPAQTDKKDSNNADIQPTAA